jgi:AcrR family transcriptional regulator
MTTVIEPHAEDVGLRERKKQQTRSAIHDAAFRLIEEQGLEATTIDQICQEADVSTRTFFNYYPSKAAAALELSTTDIDHGARDRFRSATGGLVAALCDAVGSSAELGPSHLRMKQLISRRPEMVTMVSQMMVEVRGRFVELAEERAASRQQAELAVTLVMAALGRVMHSPDDSDAPLAQRLRRAVDLLVGVEAEQLRPFTPSDVSGA